MVDILIIGGGAAGMSAALYAIRSGKKVLILEKESFGGQMATSPRIENYPSIKEISGLELADKMFTQITDAGVDFDCDEVTNITKVDDKFIVKCIYKTFEAKSVVIATGVKHRKIGVPGEEELIGKGLSYCAVCDGDFFKGKDVTVIGDANTALQYALMLSDICNKVYICTLFGKFFADNVLVDRVRNKNNIDVIDFVSLTEFVTDNGVISGLKFEETRTKELVTVECQGCFIAIGQVPSNDFLNNVVDIDSKGYIVSDNMETKTPGLFVAGDCRTKEFRQISTAVNDGAIAALKAVNYLNNL